MNDNQKVRPQREKRKKSLKMTFFWIKASSPPQKGPQAVHSKLQYIYDLISAEKSQKKAKSSFRGIVRAILFIFVVFAIAFTIVFEPIIGLWLDK